MSLLSMPLLYLNAIKVISHLTWKFLLRFFFYFLTLYWVMYSYIIQISGGFKANISVYSRLESRTVSRQWTDGKCRLCSLLMEQPSYILSYNPANLTLSSAGHSLPSLWPSRSRLKTSVVSDYIKLLNSVN